LDNGLTFDPAIGHKGKEGSMRL